jgi:aspartate aminotransferase
MLAKRLDCVEPSPTLAITGKVRQLRAQGLDVVSFGAGEPDFDTPEPIREAAIKAICDGHTRYTAGAGMPILREAVAEKFGRENKIVTTAEQVVVSCGAKQCVYNALMAICDPGDEIVIIAPYWMTYRDQIMLSGGVPVVVDAKSEPGFVPNVDSIRNAITAKTKAIIINSPSNPTGAVYPKETLLAIAEIATEAGIYVISDEIYEKHLYDGAEHHSIASFSPEIADKTITISGVSKSFAMTGWRIGYSNSNRALAKAMATIQDQVTSNASSISQMAALAALKLPDGEVKRMVQEFDTRRRVIVEGASQVLGCEVPAPRGAFYLFADFGKFVGGRIKSDVELANYLLEEHRVATVPGSVFGGPGHLRLTYALSRAEIEEGLRRIAEGVRSLM